MAYYTLITLMLVIFSIPSAIFLLDYRRLLRYGTQTSGEIVGHDIRRSIVGRTIVIPEISFKTDTGTTVTMTPIYTYFTRLHWYPKNSSVRTYYQNDNPECFVIHNTEEIIANCLIILLALGGIIGFLFIG